MRVKRQVCPGQPTIKRRIVADECFRLQMHELSTGLQDLEYNCDGYGMQKQMPLRDASRLVGEGELVVKIGRRRVNRRLITFASMPGSCHGEDMFLNLLRGSK